MCRKLPRLLELHDIFVKLRLQGGGDVEVCAKEELLTDGTVNRCTDFNEHLTDEDALPWLHHVPFWNSASRCSALRLSALCVCVCVCVCVRVCVWWCGGGGVSHVSFAGMGQELSLGVSCQ